MYPVSDGGASGSVLHFFRGCGRKKVRTDRARGRFPAVTASEKIENFEVILESIYQDLIDRATALYLCRRVNESAAYWLSCRRSSCSCCCCRPHWLRLPIAGVRTLAILRKLWHWL